MIIEFIAENFRSIKEEQVFSLVADKSTVEHPDNYCTPECPGNIHVLKSAAMFGPNASGKSTILNAIITLKKLILKSIDFKIDQKIPWYSPHKLDKQFENKPTRFEIEFIASDLYDTSSPQRYVFKTSYNSDKIISEELFLYKSAKISLLYSREKDELIKWGDYLKGKKQSIESTLLENQLFLSVAGNSKDHPLNTIYRYFRDCIQNLDQSSILNNVEKKNSTRKYLVNNELGDITNTVTNLLKAADIGIQKITIKNIDVSNILIEKDINEKIKIPDDIIDLIKQDLSQRPHAAHQKYDGNLDCGMHEFDISEESHGTIQLFELAGPIIQVLKTGCTLLIDEISANLHPDITKYIIRLFHDPKTNPNNAQLIFSTHDVTTLNSDIFRRDQLWFTNKSKYGATILYSLLEFGKNTVRKGTNFENWYLKGKFGALPAVNYNLFSINDIEEAHNGEA